MAPHIHDKIDFTASVFVVHKNKVLLRMHEKYKMWFSVGGHIELDEDPNETAIREVKEEVGLDVVLWNGNQRFFFADERNRQLIPPVSVNRHHASGSHEHVDMIYFATSESDKVTVEYEGDRSDEWRWLTKDQLTEAEFRPDVHFFALEALKELAS
jgi:8-oxo-dGTP pyrophosphatase MutT (NUDIX family)